ncbi:hypothetical protein QJS10_CPB13g00351 [Acorus calamus]|uniref:RING-type E3 ubiquitin transferase n=1 Tax=Acorus calamus TaxID=4465 RepID=A0AAV9DK82_ACOCL|nr:hypothetical protein QJS10_CPB13g00351 [Acorus calamus]
MYESLPETFEFDHGSSSSNPTIDQQIYWNGSVVSPVGTRNLSDLRLPPTEANAGNSNGWSLGGPSSSNHSLNQVGCGEIKIEHDWRASLMSHATGACPRLEERRFESPNILSLENVNINLNSNQAADEQSLMQNSSADISHDADLNAEHVGSSGQVLKAGCSMDGRRLSCKRKIFDGVGQSSVSGNTSGFQQTEDNLWYSVPAGPIMISDLNIPIPPDQFSGGHPPEEQPSSRITVRGVVPESQPASSAIGNAESSQRNFRIRINPAQHDSSPPNIWAPGNPIRRNHGWSSHQTPPVPFPYNSSDSRPTLASSSSQSQPPIPPQFPYVLRNTHPLPWNGAPAPNPRIGGSSTSIISAATRDDAMLRSMPRNFSNHTMFAPSTEIRQFPQDPPTHWSMANGNANVSGNVASTSRTNSNSRIPGIYPSPSLTSLPSQSSTNTDPRRMSEIIRHSLLHYTASERTGHSSSSQDVILQPGTGTHGHQQPNHRMAIRDGVPMSLRRFAMAADGRSRALSERIRNALDLVRRGENIRFEELLALEEQIGNVSTGLTEETILKCLKQKKYLVDMIEVAGGVEPCCVCQEEYTNGEDMGTLNCGHDFHTDCIKKWLMHKNLCPICKTTALVTT